MRHKLSGRQLSRNSAHRRAMLRNMAASLLRHETIRTTLPKAKELRRVVEPLITLAKSDTESRRRLALSRLRDSAVVIKLFDDLGRRFKARAGGYPHPAPDAEAGRCRAHGPDATGRGPGGGRRSPRRAGGCGAAARAQARCGGQGSRGGHSGRNQAAPAPQGCRLSCCGPQTPRQRLNCAQYPIESGAAVSFVRLRWRRGRRFGSVISFTFGDS